LQSAPEGVKNCGTEESLTGTVFRSAGCRVVILPALTETTRGDGGFGSTGIGERHG
jgi:hypothetical protein